MASGDTKTEAMLNALGNGGSADEFRGCCNTKTQSYILDAIDRVQNVEDEVEELKNNPDVVDIVDTYADLQAYDTQHLTNNDIIRVLQDETHDDNSTYYRFTKNPDTWTFIGEISGGSSVNVVQTTGTSTTDVMSQNATTSMVFADPRDKTKVLIGNNAGSSAYATIGIGSSAKASSARAIAIGAGALASQSCSIALGAGSNASHVGEMNIGVPNLTGTGYNNSDYRLLTGLYDPVNDHDAATKGYVDANAGGPTVVQSMGNSTTDVMSQNSVTGMIYSDTSTQKRIKIGYNAYSTPGDESIEIGKEAKASNTRGIAIGAECITESGYGIAIGSTVTANGIEAVGIGRFAHPGGERAIAIGRDATADKYWSVALGAGATTSAQGEVNVGTGAFYTTKGYNNSNYRLLSGLYDGQSAHDAVTVGQVNSVIDAINTALSTNIPHIGA